MTQQPVPPPFAGPVTCGICGRPTYIVWGRCQWCGVPLQAPSAAVVQGVADDRSPAAPPPSSPPAKPKEFTARDAGAHLIDVFIMALLGDFLILGLTAAVAPAIFGTALGASVLGLSLGGLASVYYRVVHSVVCPHCSVRTSVITGRCMACGTDLDAAVGTPAPASFPRPGVKRALWLWRGRWARLLGFGTAFSIESLAVGLAFSGSIVNSVYGPAPAPGPLLLLAFLMIVVAAVRVGARRRREKLTAAASADPSS